MNMAVPARERDRGSMLVLTMFVGLTLTAAIVLAIQPVLVDLIVRQRARSAADAAALAGVIAGRSASAELASANGATLVTWTRDGAEVTVVVDVAGHRARARATDAP